ncbi:hypothetical protein [Bradyrhizobium sp.]|uniref:hypothetical protein n=1 Tax=Bradyrhizobium sp. TaxID=376 RepID=UPI003BB0FD97
MSTFENSATRFGVTRLTMPFFVSAETVGGSLQLALAAFLRQSPTAPEPKPCRRFVEIFLEPCGPLCHCSVKALSPVPDDRERRDQQHAHDGTAADPVPFQGPHISNALAP